MKPVFQTQFGVPEGNCFMACVASILETSLDALPDLQEIEKIASQTGRNWLEALNDKLLVLRGIGITTMDASEESPANIYIPEGSYFILSGEGPRGIMHSVVYKQVRCRSNGKMIHDGDVELAHDPYPGGVGILKPKSIQLMLYRGNDA